MSRKLKIIILLATVVVLSPVLFFFAMNREKYTVEDMRSVNPGSEYIRLSAGMTEYEISGPPDGIPVVLVHGMTVDVYDWDFQFDFLTASGFRVLRYSQFGRGLSDRPYIVYDKDLYMRQLDELIDHFFSRPVDLVGHSMGGALAAEYASRYPGKTDKVVLLAPVLNAGEKNSGVSLIKIPIIGDYAAATILSPLLASRAAGLFETSKTDVTEAYDRLFRRQTEITGFSNSVKSLFRNDAIGDFSDAYVKMDGLKTLLLWGDLDNSVPAEHIERIEKLNGHIQIIRYRGINHSLNMEIPGIINGQILRFFQSSLDRSGT